MKTEHTYKAQIFDVKAGIEFTVKKNAYTKKEFIKNLRADGFPVVEYTAKPAEIFDYIVENTNATPEDFKEFNLKNYAYYIAFYYNPSLKKKVEKLIPVDKREYKTVEEAYYGATLIAENEIMFTSNMDLIRLKKVY